MIKVAVEGMTPTTVAWVRITLGGLVLYAVLRSRGGRVGLDRTLARHFVLVAALGSVVPFTLLAWGEQRITSALTAVLNASTPLFTALLAGATRQERLRPLQVAGLGVGLVGVAISAGLGASDLTGSSIAGSLAAIAAGACYGGAFVYGRQNLVGIPPIAAATGQLLAGAVILAPVALATSAVDGVDLTWRRIGAIVLLGAVGTGLAFVLNYRIIGELGATRASLVTYVIPVVAVVVGIAVLDEPFEWRLVLGGLVTIAGVAAVTVGRHSPTPAPTLAPATASSVAAAAAHR